MKNFPLVIIISLVAIQQVYSQAVMPDNLRAANAIDRLATFQGNHIPDLLYGIPAPPGKIIGDTYLDVEWKLSTVLLYDGKMIEGYPTRYDIKPNELEFNAKNGVKVLEGSKVKSFIWLDDQTKTPSYFINAKEFKTADATPIVGFFQVLYDGQFALAKKINITIKKADYNAVLNVGSPDDKILKKIELYYLSEGKVFQMPTSKKKFLAIFPQGSTLIEEFISDNSLSVTKEEDLIKIFEYYDKAVIKS